MKFSKYVVTCGIALVVASVGADLQAQAMKQSKASVRAVRGDVRYKANAAADWVPLKQGTSLNPGAIVETGSQSSVDLFLRDIGSVVRITQSTQMGIDKLGYSKDGDELVVDTELNLKAGTILGNVKKIAATSRYDVKVPNGVCGIRGTEFKVSANGVVSVVTGTVRVTYTTSTGRQIVRDVGAGQTFYPPTDPNGEPVVSAIAPTDVIWTEFKDMPTTVTPPGGGPITITPVEPTEKPPSQHTEGEPGSPSHPPSNGNGGGE